MSGRGLAVSVDLEVTSPFVKSKDGKREPEFSLYLTEESAEALPPSGPWVSPLTQMPLG